MIEEVGDPGVEADVAQVPKCTAMLLVAQRTHVELASGLTDLIGWGVEVDGDDAVHEHHQPHQRRRQEPPGVHPWERRGRCAKIRSERRMLGDDIYGVWGRGTWVKGKGCAGRGRK